MMRAAAIASRLPPMVSEAQAPAPVAHRERGMSALFAIGSLCFFVGPFPGYVRLVGAEADAITFFVGSLFFTAGGGVQTWLAFADRRGAGRADWWVATVQSAGTLFFNVTTFMALTTTLSNPHYDRLVWRPDAFGSVCFLVSGAIGFGAAERRWWQPTINLLGCVLFGFSAIAGYVVPASGSMLDLAAANWNTAAGAACFLACAVPGLRRPRDRARKSRQIHRFR